MEKLQDIERLARYNTNVRQANAGTKPLGEALKDFLDRGNRRSKSTKGEYRVRTPTRSERLNRALKELRPAAFKVHMLIWTWRGAPAKGNLPFFTIRSLERFCALTRPTLRKAITELVDKGWIQRLPYNVKCKNTLYRLIPVRKVKAPRTSGGDDAIQELRRGCRGTSAGGAAPRSPREPATINRAGCGGSLPLGQCGPTRST